eukprot:TRINITY_DN5907_c0_g1_i1.p1 TRINITY_DN5907_c0_g1~~TRINITY_DN5907_c0_g1_i1.p1  ORF type:complete len:102 (+),score=7.53 TRINITY_DN5907_c0_g1_i1:82-387(+)
MEWLDLFLCGCLAVTLRALWILPWARLVMGESRPRSRISNKRPVLISVLGSGGHTMEMMYYLRSFHRDKYSAWHFVIAETDKLSGSKVEEMDKTTPAETEV